MCLKLQGSETGLIANYRMDEGSGSSLVNASSNGSALASASLASSSAAPSRALSGAPIGDASTFNYPASWVGQTVNLASAANGTYTVSSVSGSPSGVHTYQVNAVPNSTTGTVGLGTNNVYFGTFVVNGTTPTYTATYDYGAYPAALSAESSNALYIRADNSAGSWSASAAVLNTTTNTLTLSGVSVRDEFILGNTLTPLPLELMSFSASCVDNAIQIAWSVQDEKEVAYYELERSDDGNVFSQIAKFQSELKLMNRYSYNDVKLHTVYYRLKIISNDGSSSYSTTISCNNKAEPPLIRLYPQPFNESLTVEGANTNATIRIVDLNEKEVYQSVSDTYFTTINTASLAPGVYFIHIKTATSIVTEKIIKW